MDPRCQPGFCTSCQERGAQIPYRKFRSLSDSQLFDLLVSQHCSAVLTYAQALTGDRWTAEEAAQDTFVKVWKYLDSFRGDGCFEGWLLRICRNCVFDISGRKIPTPTAKDPKIHTLPDAQPELMLLLDNLPIAQREVLTLCGLLGHTYDAAAAILDVPVGTVRSRMARGRQTLRSRLVESRQA